ncbi:hypothetical protein BUALT_Bualt01G0150200 [Buddleja alternifolia]|uniref:Uncharacterized protein n=1 Tax=Buddleja alternifolia TaxID=168488 RepID=A0AAV6Y7D2_9LAMI|nr:hypothetical protein BUALT_Bualt01G0150200 [Buddleja alternifolia]
MYNTRLRERSIKRKNKNMDPITVDEIDSDDEWIAEREDPVLPNDASWIDDENLFTVDAIRLVPATTYDREGCSRPLFLEMLALNQVHKEKFARRPLFL